MTAAKHTPRGPRQTPLQEHAQSVEARLLPHIRRMARSARPAWVDRMVRERYPARMSKGRG